MGLAGFVKNLKKWVGCVCEDTVIQCWWTINMILSEKRMLYKGSSCLATFWNRDFLSSFSGLSKINKSKITQEKTWAVRTILHAMDNEWLIMSFFIYLFCIFGSRCNLSCAGMVEIGIHVGVENLCKQIKKKKKNTMWAGGCFHSFWVGFCGYFIAVMELRMKCCRNKTKKSKKFMPHCLCSFGKLLQKDSEF